MRTKFVAVVGLVLLGITLFNGCATDFEVNAPYRDIATLYGILNPTDSVQYIRLQSAFQIEEDAIEYAANNDLSIKGAEVRLTDGTNVWVAEEVDDIVKEEGSFFTEQTVYKFVTDGSGPGREALEGGTTYTIEVGRQDADGIYMTAETTVPRTPAIRGSLSLTPGAGGLVCLPRLFLDRPFQTYWTRLDEENTYELRVSLKIEDDGEEKILTWESGGLIEDNQRCNQGSANVCYEFFEDQLLLFWSRNMPDDGSNYTYDTGDSCAMDADRLPESLWFEVTANDLYLSNYININDPAQQDVSGARPEYTNVSGNIDAYGIFGSANSSRRYAIMRPCSEAKLGLNDRQFPPECDPF